MRRLCPVCSGSFDRVLSRRATRTPLLADLTLAVALAAWLRAALGSLLRVGWACFTAALLRLLAVFAAAPLTGLDTAPQAAGTGLWHRGVAHHAITFALAAVFTQLAQRAWLTADLHELARRSKAAQDELRSR